MRTSCLACLAFAILAVLAIKPAHAALIGAEQGAVVLAAGAAFALPALLAGFFVLLRQVARTLGPVLSTAVVGLTALLIAGCLRPEVFGAFGL